MDNKFMSGFIKTAGLFSSLDDIARAGKKFSDEGAEVTHKLDKEQLKKILDTIDNVKPAIRPIHLLGASVLAGAGFPLGQYLGNRTKDVAQAVTGLGPAPIAREPEPSVAIYPRQKRYI